MNRLVNQLLSQQDRLFDMAEDAEDDLYQGRIAVLLIVAWIVAVTVMFVGVFIGFVLLMMVVNTVNKG